MIKAQQVESPIEIIQDPAVLSLEIQSPNVRGWAVGVSNHLQNAKYLGSMLPFSVSVIGSLGCKSNHERQVLTGLNLRWWNFATKMPPWLPSSNNFRQICKSFVESILTSPTKTIKKTQLYQINTFTVVVKKTRTLNIQVFFTPNHGQLPAPSRAVPSSPKNLTASRIGKQIMNLRNSEAYLSVSRP